MEVVSLKTVAKQCNENVIQLLEEMLERAKKGEIISFSGVFWLDNGEYQTLGSGEESRLKTVGALMQIIIDRLGAG
jgi:hypothetical protein